MSDNKLEYQLSLNAKPLIQAIREAMGTVKREVGVTQDSLSNFQILKPGDLEKVNRDIRGMGNAARQAEPELAGVKKELTGIGQVTGKATGAVRTFVNVAAGIAGVTVGIAGLQQGIGAVIRTGSQFETLAITLNSLTGSAEKGKKAMEWIEDFAENTPLQLDGVTQAFIKMTAFGMEPMNGAMQSLVDINAKYGGSQVDLDGIINAVGKSWSKQKLQTEEAIMLIERGIPVWALLADALGKTETEIQDMATAGELGRDAIQALLDQMGEVGQGAAKAQMESWSGLVSNMGDTWTSFLNTIAQSGTLDYFKAQLEELLRVIEEMKESGELAQIAQDISDKIVALMEVIKAVITTIYDWRDEIIQVGIALAGLKLLGLISGLAKLVTGIKTATVAAGGLKAAMMSLNPALIAVAGTIASFNLGGLLTELALVETGFLDWAYGSSVATDETKRLIDNMVRLKPELDKLQELKLEAGQMGLNQVADSLEQIRIGTIAGRISAEQLNQALSQARIDIDSKSESIKAEQARQQEIEKAKQQYRDLASEKSRLEDEVRARNAAREEEERRKTTEKSLADKKQSLEQEARDALDAKRRSLDDLAREEQSAQEEINRIKRGAMLQTLGIEEQLMKIRRDSLSGAEREAQLRADIATFSERAERAIKQGDTETAQDYASRIQAMTGEIEKTDEKVAALMALEQMSRKIAQVEEARVVAGVEASRRETEATIGASAQKRAIIERDISAINQILAKLEAEKEIPLSVDDQNAIDRINEIERKLAELSRGVNIPISASGGVNLPGFNTGGHIPGYGGGDIVPAMVEPGEYVIRKEMVRKYGLGFIESINRGMAGASAPGNITVPRIPRYQTGGLVAPMAPTETVRLQIQSGGTTSTVTGGRSDIDGLIGQLRKLEITR